MGAEGRDYQLTAVVRISDGADSLTGSQWAQLAARVRELAEARGSMTETWYRSPEHPIRSVMISAGIGTDERLRQFRHLLTEALRAYPAVHCTVMTGMLSAARPPVPDVCSPDHCRNGVACYAPACYGSADYGRV